ncbi:hypothetical protein RHSIM_Rhsim12G0005800 [Rhododendron simsii]|uniref:Pentatricopeptide repeat-containing protein n=1 Tax=Rhododendron simsii TaxID=118357 RepID=A0A834G4Y0_RHOSS|nr:hypothetical protein RHSIM_Rhsim12G0005800 [Rhododendron simsii]
MCFSRWEKGAEERKNKDKVFDGVSPDPQNGIRIKKGSFSKAEICIEPLPFRRAMAIFSGRSPMSFELSSIGKKQMRISGVNPLLGFGFSKCRISSLHMSRGLPAFAEKASNISMVNPSHSQGQPLSNSKAIEKKVIKKVGKKEHHLWQKRDSAGSGQKALNLVRIVSGLPNEKEAVYGALDKWTAWETEFPLIAASKALRMLRKRSRWIRVIQVAKWMLSKGQGATMGTYDTLLLAFDMDQRVDEAESLWNMILHTHTRSISKQLFARMISLYDHHNIPEKIIEVYESERDLLREVSMTELSELLHTQKLNFVFADMEELGVKPDEDTVRKVACAFQNLGQVDNQKLVLRKYLSKWKYIHFKGERVRVRRETWDI